MSYFQFRPEISESHTQLTVKAGYKTGLQNNRCLVDGFLKDHTEFIFVLASIDPNPNPEPHETHMILSSIKTAIRALSTVTSSPSDILTKTNDSLLSSPPHIFSASAFLGVLNIDTGKLSFANAGHRSPLLLKSDAEPTPFPSTNGIPLGCEPMFFYQSHSIELSPTQAVIAISDQPSDSQHQPPNPNSISTLYTDATNLTEFSHAVDTHIAPNQSDEIQWLTFTWNPIPVDISNTLAVHFKNQIAEITKLHQVVELFGKANSLDQTTQNRIDMVFEELLSNTIAYGYNDHDPHTIYATLAINDNTFTGTLKDDGIPFNPLDAPEIDVDTLLETPETGGLGVHFIKAFTSHIHYERSEPHNLISFSIDTKPN